MTPALARPWGPWLHRGIATEAGRGGVPKMRPATRLLLLGLGGWAAGTFILAVVAVLWPLSASMPDPLPSRSQGHAQDYTAITQRPLFARTRHPNAMPLFVAPPPLSRDHDILLKGVFLNGSQTRAFLTSGAEPQGRWLGVKSIIAGWTIVSLTPDEVRLEADGETMTVSMHRTSQGTTLSSPSPAMPIFPHLVPYPNVSNQPTNARAMDPGQRPNLQEMMGASPPSMFGLRMRPEAKAP